MKQSLEISMIIGDSSALITLAVVEQLELLEKIFGKVYVPKAVWDEVTNIQRPHGRRLKEFLKDKVVKVDLQVKKLGLGLGELEAITLYKQLDADLLLIDDQRAKKFAILNDVKVVGSLSVLIKAKELGLIEKVKPYLEKINNSNIFIAQSLIQKVLVLVDEAEL